MSTSEAGPSSPNAAPNSKLRKVPLFTPSHAKRLSPEPFPDSRSAKRAKRSSNLKAAAPLAERLRPSSLAEFVGQPHLTNPDTLFIAAIRAGSYGSMILWGPPGYVSQARFLANPNLLEVAAKQPLHD
jgi:putative ATPase